MPNPPSVAAYEVVSNTVQITNQTHVTVSVSAPTGKRVLGGGGKIDTYASGTNLGAFALIASAPTSGETGWECEWFAAGNQSSATFTVTALCGTTT